MIFLDKEHLMKKIIYSLLAIFSILCTFAFSACQSGGDSEIEILYGEKYIHYLDINNGKNQRYFLFNKDGTAQFYCANYGSKIKHYTLHLICEPVVEENTIFCFFDSIEYADDHETGKILSYEIYTILCSKNIIMTSDGIQYIAESYLAKIPNFNK